MVRLLVMLACALFLGCTSQPKYLEGTSISLGAYIPWSGSIYGLELLNYTNGAVVKGPSNIVYEIQRNHSATNRWCWGMLETVEHTDTKIKLP